MTRSNLVAALLLSVAALVMYARRLDVSPPSLHPDEMALREQARSIAETGRDPDGRVLPLFFHLRENAWSQALPVYFTALSLTALDLSGSRLRLPSAILGALDVALLYVVARRLFRQQWLAVLASTLLALTPLHFIHARLAMASVYPVACLLVWLLCVIAFVQLQKSWLLFVSTLSLGVGFYSHPSAVLMMPVYVALTALTLVAIGSPRPLYLLAVAGFAAPLLVLVPWFYFHHDIFRLTLGDWGLHTIANPRDGLRYSVLNWTLVAARSSVYWSFFSPSYLFFTGGSDVVSSTRHAGVFLSLSAIPLIGGVYQIVKSRWSDPLWRLVLLGFAAAPLAASTFNERAAAGRAVGALPFGVLVAVAGIDYLFRHRLRTMRLAVIGVLLLLPIQFYSFCADYFGDYPQRASAAFGAAVRE